MVVVVFKVFQFDLIVFHFMCSSFYLIFCFFFEFHFRFFLTAFFAVAVCGVVVVVWVLYDGGYVVLGLQQHFLECLLYGTSVIVTSPSTSWNTLPIINSLGWDHLGLLLFFSDTLQLFSICLFNCRSIVIVSVGEFLVPSKNCMFFTCCSVVVVVVFFHLL